MNQNLFAYLSKAAPARNREWEATLRGWSKPSSDSEASRMENAERLIREAIDESPALRERSIDVFTQGSYRNNTNTRQDSDVDIGVLCHDTYFPNYSMAPGANDRTVGLIPATYRYEQFKDEVGDALIAKFGSRGVTRGNKCFDVHENTYRVSADVVAVFDHRRYTRQLNGVWLYETGTELRTDEENKRIINWPAQHYENGVDKNRRTGGRFKFLTRALKRLRAEMDDARIKEAGAISSFLIECLVWNVPDDHFGHEAYRDDMRAVLAFTFNNTLSDSGPGEWGEVSERKYLFRSSQPWTRTQAHAFIGAAWDYMGLT